MKWHRLCGICEHREEFDPLVDECPYEQDPVKCGKKMVNNLKAARGIEPFPETATPKKRHRSRPEVMPQPKPYYTHGDKYPDSVRISFEDGHTEIYDRRISQPSPVGYVNNSRRGKA